jgi:hypothetical protein
VNVQGTFFACVKKAQGNPFVQLIYTNKNIERKKRQLLIKIVFLKMNSKSEI